MRPKEVLSDAAARERFLGCLLGGAVGDALGAPVEFLSWAGIQQSFGSAGIQEYAPAWGGVGMITDDTQMTMFTAEGLLRGWVRERVLGESDYAATIGAAYLRWLTTQGARPLRRIGEDALSSGWLIRLNELHSDRAPGNTCLTALHGMEFPGQMADNESKGCGGVMRAAPAGLFAARLEESDAVTNAFELGKDAAALTHGHVTGQLTAGVLAVMVMRLVQGAGLEDALREAKEELLRYPGHEETLKSIELAEKMVESGLPASEAIARQGGGWIAEEALGIAIYSALRAKDFTDGVVMAVNHSGDSDSTGAIAGNLLGALHGVNGIGADWLEGLELQEEIAELAEDLYEFPQWELRPGAKTGDVWEKYPG